MWKIGPTLKKDMESRLAKVTAPSSKNSMWGVFLFTLFMVSREGMETALLLLQIRDPQLIGGILSGILGAAVVAFLWQQFSYQIKLKHFFQVTAVFLSLFAVQILVHAIHEFSEMGILPFSDVIDKATDSLSMYGYYGKKFSLFTMVGCGLWLLGSWVIDQFGKEKTSKE
jgi:high-affinity iron transporter